MERKKLWQTIILLIVFIIAVAFPIKSMSNDPTLILSIQIGIITGFIIFALIYVYATKLAHFYQGNVNFKNTFLLLPLFFVAFCNLFFMTVFENGKIGNVHWNDPTFILQIVLALLTAFAEELVFRFIIQKNLAMSSKVGKILVASSIFAVCHFFTVIARWNLTAPATWNWFDLTMIVYTFFIGVCLGFLYEYTNNIILPIAFHFIFNFINDVWFYVESWTWPYFFNVLIFGAFGIGYICLFYFVFTKREYR